MQKHRVEEVSQFDGRFEDESQFDAPVDGTDDGPFIEEGPAPEIIQPTEGGRGPSTQLCVEVESLVDSKEWKKATDQIKKLQEEWKKIGPVPKRHSDKIWKRFRSACDSFFTNKSEHFSGIKGVEEENLKLKNELLERIKAYEIKIERSENMNAIKGFQREWMSIGHVPMKYKDALQDEYRKSIDALFDKMKITEIRLATRTVKAV